MVNHNRDDQKEEEEKQDYSDSIPKKNPSKKFNANWSNDLLQSKQISKKFFLKIEDWKNELYHIIEKIVFSKTPSEHRLAGSEKIRKKLEKWVIDKFDLFVDIEINDPFNLLKYKQISKRFHKKIILSILMGEIYNLPSQFKKMNPFLKPAATRIYYKFKTDKEENGHPIMEQFFRDKDVTILKNIGNFEEIFTKFKAKHYIVRLFQTTKDIPTKDIPLTVLYKITLQMTTNPKIKGYIYRDRFSPSKVLSNDDFWFIFGQIITSSSANEEVKDMIFDNLLLFVRFQLSNHQLQRNILDIALKYIDINVQNSNGYTILLYTLESGNLDMLKYLLRKYKDKIDINVQSSDGNTILIRLIVSYDILSPGDYAKKIDLIKYLLRKYKDKIDINIQNQEGKTALIYSVIYNQNDIVDMLLNIKKIDINIKDNDNKNALFYAIKNDIIPSLPISEYLINKGAKYLDDDGITTEKCHQLKKIVSPEFQRKYRRLYQTLCEISTQESRGCKNLLKHARRTLGITGLKTWVNINPDNKIISFFRHNRTPAHIVNIHKYKFVGQPGIDASGLTKIYWDGIGNELIELGLFIKNEETGFGEINPTFDCQKQIKELKEDDEKENEKVINKLENFDLYLRLNKIDDFELYKKIGQMFAKAFLIEEPLNLRLSFNILYRLVYKKLSKNIYGLILYLDDPQVFKSLYNVVGMKDTSVRDYLLQLNFENIGESPKKVTFGNYDEFIHKKTKWLLDINEKEKEVWNPSTKIITIKKIGSWEDKLSGFVQGFNSIIPREIINKHNVKDIQDKINGVDLTDDIIRKWANEMRLDRNVHTNWEKKQIDVFNWFKEIITTIPKIGPEKKLHYRFIQKLIVFMTGKTSLDFSEKNKHGFRVTVDMNKKDFLPSAHVCINQIVLGIYDSKQILLEKLKKIVFDPKYSTEGTDEAGGGRRKNHKKTNKLKKSKPKRKHSGINQQTGRLKKGFKYSGKKLKSGLPEIIKVKKIKN